MVDHFEIIKGEILICLLHFTFMIISLSNNFNIVIPLDVYLHYSFEKLINTFVLMLFCSRQGIYMNRLGGLI